jgi:hypothetical protein
LLAGLLNHELNFARILLLKAVLKLISNYSNSTQYAISNRVLCYSAMVEKHCAVINDLSMTLVSDHPGAGFKEGNA